MDFLSNFIFYCIIGHIVSIIVHYFMLSFAYSAWITEDLIWPYSEYREKYKSSQRPSRVFQEAVDTAEDLFKSQSTEKVVITAQLSCLISNIGYIEILFKNHAYCCVVSECRV